MGWLLGIARHVLLRTWEKGRTERRAQQRLGVEPVVCTDASLERVEALADANHPDNPLLRALDALPTEQAVAVRAHVLDEQPYEDLARDLGVPAATLRQRVSRGLSRIRTTVREESP